MKAMRIHSFGGPDVLSYDDVERPVPGDGEVLIRVSAASVNPVDWKIREGGYPAVKEADLPMTMGRDVSGVVESVGGHDLPFREGDEVYAFIGSGGGGYEEFAIAKIDEVGPKPSSLSHAEAAAVPLAGTTAWQGLFEHGKLAARQRVLIHGGAGGVGHLAIQFAKAKDAWVATTVSGEDADFAAGIGADQVIDYRTQRFEDLVEPVDLVFDLIGGETRDRSFGVLKQDGILVSTLGEPDQEKARRHRVRAAGYIARPDGEQLREIAQLIDTGKIRVEVQQIFTLSDAAIAQEFLKQKHTRGKVVLEVA